MGIYEFDVYRVGFEDVGSGVSTQGLGVALGKSGSAILNGLQGVVQTSSYSHSAHMYSEPAELV